MSFILRVPLTYIASVASRCAWDMGAKQMGYGGKNTIVYTVYVYTTPGDSTVADSFSGQARPGVVEKAHQFNDRSRRGALVSIDTQTTAGR